MGSAKQVRAIDVVLERSFMVNKANARRCRPSWSVGAFVLLVWLMVVPSLMAKIQDVRKEIAQESAQYFAEHFSDGRMPPMHDWRKQRPLRQGEEVTPEAPGGVGYGYYFYNNVLLWTNSTIADYYVIVPTFPGQNLTNYLYLTSTCRSQLGTESLIAYTPGPNEAAFWIYDWAQAQWQVAMDLPLAHPQYLTTRPDEFAINRQMIHVRNGTYYLGFANGQFQWRNQVMLFNFTRDDWDLIYSYNYGTANLTDNIYTSGDGNGFWGPIVETFGTYTNINPVGFDLIRLFQDANANSSWLNPANSYVVMASPWQLLTRATNTSFTVAVNPTNKAGGAYDMGTLCVTANTNAASFSLIPPAGTNSSGWVIIPLSNSWDKVVVGLPPGAYSITFNPLSRLATPAPQMFTIAANNITTVQAVYDVPAPNFQSMTATSNSIIFSWNSITGLMYQPQYKTNLTQPNWIDLGGTITASNAILSATDTFGLDPQRFYRVQQHD